MAGATIKLFLPKGEAQSLRTAELLNWTGKAIAGPRSELDELLSREELNKSGVYFLIGFNPETGKPMAYIGEAEVVKDRLKQHRDKEFWIHAIVFVSKDENLTKSHIRYLEGRLIEEATEVARYEISNSQASGSKLPESDREDMEVFLSRVRQLLPVLGCDILTSVIDREKRTIAKSALTCKIKGLTARGQRTANGFVVFKESEVVSEFRPSAPAYVIQTRERLIAEKFLVQEGNKFIFTRDQEFSSPSMAAAIIAGGHINGLTAWKDNDGRTLKEIEGVI